MPHPILFMNWVADVRAAGRGQSALKYLAAYLYRTAFNAERILEDDGRFITFSYRHNSGQTRTVRLPAESFLHRFLQPSGSSSKTGKAKGKRVIPGSFNL